MMNQQILTLDAYLEHAPAPQRTYQSDRFWSGTLWILSAPIFEGRDIESYIDRNRVRSIDFEGLFQASLSWSRQEQVLIEVACSLRQLCNTASLFRIINVLDETNFEIVLQAMRRCR